MKLQVQAPRDRAHRQCLGQARHALEQDMAAGEQTEQQAIDEVALADDDAAHRAIKGVEASAHGLDVVVALCQVAHSLFFKSMFAVAQTFLSVQELIIA